MKNRFLHIEYSKQKKTRHRAGRITQNSSYSTLFNYIKTTIQLDYYDR